MVFTGAMLRVSTQVKAKHCCWNVIRSIDTITGYLIRQWAVRKQTCFYTRILYTQLYNLEFTNLENNTAILLIVLRLKM